ncbi:MAG: Protein containing Methyltransferase type 11domain [Myxococcaceae bacterium]|nr:Protein containing Methyltransferase type 11domain [Myxococcaceae bacterium]
MTERLQSPYHEQEASSYDHDREREPHWQREADYVRALLQRRAPRRLLDAPVGTGRFLPLCGKVSQIAGVDLSGAMLHRSKQRALELQLTQLVLVRGSLAAIPLASATFDLTLCCRFMHLIPSELVGTMFRELARVTAGRVCVQAYVRGPLRWRLESRVRRVARGLLTRARGAGAEPWSHIAAHFHPEQTFLSAASAAGLRLASRAEIDRYNATRVMMYEWDTP